MTRILVRRMLDSSPAQLDLGLLLLRSWFGLVLALGHGLGKVTGLEAFAAGVAKQGLPAPMLFALLAAGSEFAGGLLLALGLFTRAAALSIVVTMLVAAFHVHAADPFGKKEFALAYGAAALALLVAGAGRFSIDRWLSSRAG